MRRFLHGAVERRQMGAKYRRGCGQGQGDGNHDLRHRCDSLPETAKSYEALLLARVRFLEMGFSKPVTRRRSRMTKPSSVATETIRPVRRDARRSGWRTSYDRP